jgi:molybdopterin/thiamine biosynthesis adenylyltransferase
MNFIQTSHHEPFGIADGEQAKTAPRFYRVRSNEDLRQLQDWVNRMPGLQVYDTIEQQVQDWIQTRHPKRKLQPSEMAERLNAHWSFHRRSEYGVWVYYPWSQRLVHVLDELEFRELRTNRNRNKITAEEQARLQEKSIGIVGLSVGNAVALTLTLEGVYGHLTIADHDRLDLSNMNRIRASVCDIGIPKTTMTARQIYEIDPFAKLTLFSDGLHAENIASFLDSGGGLDCVIDECDDIRMKIMIREQARARRIPVLMETSDRGMLDVERFDLEPNRPVLHGLLGEATSHTIPTQMSSDEKLKYVLPILGVTQISARAGA